MRLPAGEGKESAVACPMQQMSSQLYSPCLQLIPVPPLRHPLCRGAWLLLYIAEAIAIIAVLKQYPNDTKKAVSRPILSCPAFC
jgi:hypothetical protein